MSWSSQWSLSFWLHIESETLQRLQNRVLHAIGNYDMRTTVHDLHLAFKIPYVYDYITKLCRRQAVVILNHKYPKCTCNWTRRSQA
jgi:hypothetical protein